MVLVLLWSLIFFSVAYTAIAFQAATEVRSEFGATWLPSEVFWELFVTKANGLYILLLGIFLSILNFKWVASSFPDANLK
ncbi:hypothetical protein [Maribacter sp. 2-571]|uniref:hypothetical protein n=1 Tax=Maribacter sp. 2-571 TaxID=3417569 RepID=UPI003D32F004